jgi:hypothetical protein
MPNIVRLATQSDRPALRQMCVMLHEENGMFPLNLDKLDRALDRYFNRDGAVIGVIGQDGEPVASIYLGITQFFYTDAWTLMEEWAFVMPEHRRTTYAQDLITYAKSVSDGMKMPLITGILSSKRTEAKVRLYDRMMERVGGYFMHGREHITTQAWS